MHQLTQAIWIQIYSCGLERSTVKGHPGPTSEISVTADSAPLVERSTGGSARTFANWI